VQVQTTKTDEETQMALKFLKLVLSATLVPLLIQPAFAHSIWIDRGEKPGELKILYGHPELNETDPYDSIKFQSARAYDEAVHPVQLSVQRRYNGVTLVPQRKIVALTARHNNGYFVVRDNNYINVFRPDALAANNEQTNVVHTYKYAKAFYESSGLVSSWFGLPLEIIPQQDPFTVGAGGTLKVLVLYRGTPQQGATVEYRGKMLTTNQNGFAFVTLGQGSFHVIESEYSVPSQDPAADEIGHASSLTIDGRGTR
jgi:nickel transport protein